MTREKVEAELIIATRKALRSAQEIERSLQDAVDGFEDQFDRAIRDIRDLEIDVAANVRAAERSIDALDGTGVTLLALADTDEALADFDGITPEEVELIGRAELNDALSAIDGVPDEEVGFYGLAELGDAIAALDGVPDENVNIYGVPDLTDAVAALDAIPDEEVIIRGRLDVDEGQLRDAGGRFVAEGEEIGDGISEGILGGIVGAGGAARLLTGLGIGAVALGINDVTNRASDLGESQSKNNALFADYVDLVNDFAADAPDTVGLSERQALDAIGSFGALAVGMQAPRDEAALLSNDLTVLAADLASFNNLEVDDVTERLRAGLFLGSTESLAPFAPITAELVELEGEELGFLDDDVFTPYEKAQARLALLLEATADQQGDFARTSDGLANQQRILAANLDEFGTAAGQAFVPLATGAVSLANQALPFVVDALEELTTGVITVQEFVARYWPLVEEVITDVSEAVADVIDEYWPPIYDVIEPAVSAVGDLVDDVFGNVSGVLDGAGGGFDRLGDALDNAINGIAIPLFEILKIEFAALLDLVEGVVPPIADVAINTFRTIEALVVPTVTGLLATIELTLSLIRSAWDTFGVQILNVVRNYFELAVEVITTAVEVIAEIVNAALAIIRGDFGEAWEAILGATTAALEGLRDIVFRFMELVASVIELALKAIAEIFLLAWEGMQGTVEGVLGGIAGFISDTLSSIAETWDLVWNGLATLLGTVWETIKETVSGAVGSVTETLDGIVDTIGGLPEKITDAAAGMFDGILDALNAMLGPFKDAWNAIANVINGAGVDIPSVSIPGVGSIGGGRIGIPDDALPTFSALNGMVLTEPFFGLAALAENATAQPEIITPQRLMAQTFRDVLAETPSSPGGLGSVTFAAGAVQISVSGGDVRQAAAAGRAAGRGVVDEVVRAQRAAKRVAVGV